MDLSNQATLCGRDFPVGTALSARQDFCILYATEPDNGLTYLSACISTQCALRMSWRELQNNRHTDGRN